MGKAKILNRNLKDEEIQNIIKKYKKVKLVLNKKRTAKDIKINFVLALINGPIRAIAVAPHIDNPDANKTLSFKFNLNTIHKIKDNTNENIMNNKTHIA